MKRLAFTLATLLFCLCLLVECNHQHKDKLTGVWRLQSLEINGTVIGGKSLGDWQWDFNGKGDYSTNIGGTKETGIYTLKENALTLKSVTHKERPEQKLQVIHLDSLQMHLVSADGGPNKSTLKFSKLGESQ